MNQQTLELYVANTETMLQKGKAIFTDQKCLFETFVPGSYLDFHKDDIRDRTRNFPLLAEFQENLSTLKKTVQGELIDIIHHQKRITIGEAQPLLSGLTELESSLGDFERKFIERPMFVFVSMLINTGTPMDFIGFIEKLRYDKVHKTGGMSPQKIDMYVGEITRAFIIKYGKDMYSKIESFRKKFLQLASVKSDSSDDIMPKQSYQHFMQILTTAYQENTFQYPEDYFLQMIQDIILSTLSETHESRSGE